ncbi:MAG TPA: GntR family transcriptional regulator [Planctomycetota bacterium]|nr:GntR family transcriptional regulator [Planctomycetota bacterium]
MPVEQESGAALTAEVAGIIRKKHLAGADAAVKFLPSERDLAKKLGVSRTTVRHALGLLETEGLIRAEHGRGYRRLPKSSALAAGSRIAILRPLGSGGISDQLAASLQRVALGQGAQVLSLGPAELSARSVSDSLVEAKVWGVVLTLDDPEMHRAIQEAGLPCVAVDCASRALDIDYVNQDNFGGAAQAAEHLLSKGHRRIAWFGPVAETPQSLERFAGAGSAFTRHGAELPRGLIVPPAGDREAAAREMLSRPDRPTAVLAMWLGEVQAVCRAARSLKLVPGRDLDVVGWSNEEVYREQIVREFGAAGAPPMVVWSTDEMARVAVARLEWRLRDRELRPLRISIPTRLVLPAEGIKEERA